MCIKYIIIVNIYNKSDLYVKSHLLGRISYYHVVSLVFLPFKYKLGLSTVARMCKPQRQIQKHNSKMKNTTTFIQFNFILFIQSGP